MILGTNRYEKARKLMQKNDVDAMIVCKPENVYYMSGFRAIIWSRPLIPIIPLDGEPIFVVPKLEEVHVKEDSWIKDIRLYTDADFIDGSMYKYVGDALKERKIEKVGIEKTSMSVDMFERIKSSSSPRTEFRDCSNILVDLRIIKSEEEIAATREAVKKAEEGMKYVFGILEEGVTERTVALKLFFKLLEVGMDRDRLPLVLSGPRGALPHGMASERVIKKGDFIVLDFGGRIRGYTSDMTRTPVIAEPSEKQKKVYQIVLEANKVAREAVKPGKKASEIDAAARKVIEKAGYGSYFFHRTGHGLGLETHEKPFIGSTDQTVLRPGMIFTIEPGIYLAGEFGVRIEDDILVTVDGGETLTTLPREINILK